MQVSVPIYVSLLLMFGYIMLGAFLFALSEDWDTLVAAYFCFITLSTIGFGDYVPGTSLATSRVPASTRTARRRWSPARCTSSAAWR